MTVSIFTEANQFLRTGQLDKAVIAYHQAIDQNPNFYAYYQNLAEALAKRGDWQESVAAYRHVVIRPNWFSWY